MATEKQLAALAKARAARKKNATSATKKPVKKVAVNAASRATGKTPSARLKARRKKNLTAPKGYYPNPKAPAKYLVKVTAQSGKCGYYVRDYAPGSFETDSTKATKLSKANAEGAAIAIFNKFKRGLKQVEVVNAKK